MALHLVTGGSGFIGRRLVHRLCREGERVRVLDLLPPEGELPPTATFVHGSVLDPQCVQSALKDVDYVFHLAALVPITRSGRRFWETNVLGTQTVLDAASKARVRMFVHMSSSAVFGIPQEVPIQDNTLLAPIEDYGKSKAEAERRVLLAAEKGLPCVIIRPRTVVGRTRLGIFHILFDWIYEGRRVYILGDGSNRFQLIHLDDLVEVCLLSARKEVPGTYNVGTDRFGTLRELLENLISHADTPSRVVGLPAGPSILAMRILDQMGVLPLTPWHYRTYHSDFFFDITRAVSQLGWKPWYSNDEMIQDTYDWFVAHREELRRREGSVHLKPIREGILALLRRLS